MCGVFREPTHKFGWKSENLTLPEQSFFGSQQAGPSLAVSVVSLLLRDQFLARRSVAKKPSREL